MFDLLESEDKHSDVYIPEGMEDEQKKACEDKKLRAVLNSSFNMTRKQINTLPPKDEVKETKSAANQSSVKNGGKLDITKVIKDLKSCGNLLLDGEQGTQLMKKLSETKSLQALEGLGFIRSYKSVKTAPK